MSSVTGKSLGKQVKRDDPRNLKLAKYLRGAQLPEIKTDISYYGLIPKWDMFLNDVLGDCVIAAAAHMIQQWTRYAQDKEAVVTDKQVLVAYEAVGGYVPGDPSTDNGCVLLDALKYWRNHGIANHKIHAFVEVNVRNVHEVKTAIQLFGNCYLGVQLPVTAQTQDPAWIVTDPTRTSPTAQPGSWGGHCVPLVAGHKRALSFISWGEVMHMTPNFLRCYADEGYAVLTQDWISANGKAPSGFDLATLEADLARL